MLFLYILIYLSISGFILLLLSFPEIDSFAAPLGAFALISLILYPFVLFSIGGAGIIALRCLNCGCFLWFLIRLWRHRQERESFSLKRILKNEKVIFFLLFSILFFFLAFLSKAWFLYDWDEFDNWSMTVRSLLRFGEKRLDVTHPSYPPGISLYWYYLCSNAEYSEHTQLFGSVLLAVSGILYAASAMFGDLKRRCLALAAVGSTAICLLYMFGFRLNTLYVDGMVGILFGALLIRTPCLKLENKAEFTLFVLILSFFTMIKDVCIYFYAVIFMLLGIELWMKKSSKGTVTKIIPAMLVPAALYFSWEARNRILFVQRVQNFDKLTVHNILSLFTGDIDRIRLQIWENITNAFFRENFESAPLSFCRILLLTGCILLFIFMITRRKDFLIENCFLFLGLLGYIMIVDILYILAMGDGMANVLNSYTRFLMSGLLAWLLFIISWLIKETLQKTERVQPLHYLTCLLLFFIFFFTPFEQIFSHPRLPSTYWTASKQFYTDYRDLIPDGSIIGPVLKKDDGTIHCMLRGLWIGEAEILFPYQIDDGLLSEEDYIDYLEENDVEYLWVMRANDLYWDAYNDLFDTYEQNSDEYQLFKRIDKGHYQRLYYGEEPQAVF